MKTLRSRLRRLSYADVMATIAVFVALGGVSYAAATISGNSIIKGTVGAGKLKNGTLTDQQIKKNALTGEAINESSLGTVPSAQTAASATTAATATTATTAQSAANADHALSADTAGKATSATSANVALLAEDAETLDGLSAKQLQVTCPVDTELYGGMCWDEEVRDADDWIDASRNCGNAGGRLPSLSELIAYVLQDGTQVGIEQNWTSDVADLEAQEIVLTSNEVQTETSPSSPFSLDYRCLFYRVN